MAKVRVKGWPVVFACGHDCVVFCGSSRAYAYDAITTELVDAPPVHYAARVSHLLFKHRAR